MGIDALAVASSDYVYVDKNMITRVSLTNVHANYYLLMF